MKLPKGFEIIGTELYPYQIESVNFGIIRPNAGLLLDLGLGKTICAITIARYRIQKGEIEKVLVVCPSTLLLNWKRQIERFSEYGALILASNDRGERLTKACLKDYPFNIINYEGLYPLLRDLSVLRKEKGSLIIENKELLEEFNYNMIIFDESARYLKNYASQRSVASIVLADYAKYKLILTGTIVANRPLDLWTQFRVLDGGKTFYTNPYMFKNKFFDKTDYGMFKKYTLKKQYISFFRSAIYKSCIRYTKKEVAPFLPEKIYHTIEIEMPPQLEKIYRKIEKQIISEIITLEGTVELTILNILTRLIRLQQITSGYVSEGKGKEKELPFKPKLEALIEELETIIDNEEYAIVWCRFTKSIDLISERLKDLNINHVILDGRVTNKKEKDNIWKTYQKDPDMWVFIGQVESGGFGIELFKEDSNPEKSQHDITYEGMYSVDIKEQSEGRIHRYGQKSTCRYINLIVKNTIDEKIEKIRVDKKILIDEIIEMGPRRFFDAK
uniref:Putative SNF2-related protein n=1 Tax=viral metagenome TaxID=1070528 RepID=A0A6H1ZS03_9ZZZZ